MALENKKQLIIIVLAVLAGVVAVFLVSNYVKNTIQNQTTQLAEQYDIKQKQMAQAMQQRSDQQAAALEGEIERVKQEDQAAMKQQAAELQAAQQRAMAMQQQMATQKPVVRKPSLALKTPVGKRAVTIKIDSLSAVGGLINAGDFVDVIAQLTVPAQDADKKSVTAMIFQGVQVLAVNTNEDDPGAYDDQQSQASLKITVAVDPQEAGLLTFADHNGTLELALRSPDDTQHQTVKANTWKTLADYVIKNQGLDINNPDGVAAPETKPEETTKPSIQIFRAGKEL